MTQLSAGFQAGGKTYSQIIFFLDKRSLEEVEAGSFEFAAVASATASLRLLEVAAALNASNGPNQLRIRSKDYPIRRHGQSKARLVDGSGSIESSVHHKLEGVAARSVWNIMRLSV